MLVQRNKENFVKDFMIVTLFSYNGKLKARKIEKMPKLTRITIRNIF